MDANPHEDTLIGVRNVSIHAPVMDANYRLTLSLLAHPCFNPRARDGREDT